VKGVKTGGGRGWPEVDWCDTVNRGGVNFMGCCASWCGPGGGDGGVRARAAL